MAIRIRRLLRRAYERTLTIFDDLVNLRRGDFLPLNEPQQIPLISGTASSSKCIHPEGEANLDIPSEDTEVAEGDIEGDPFQDEDGDREADFTEHDATIILAIDQSYRNCYAMFVTESLACKQMSAAKRSLELEVKEGTSKRLAKKIRELNFQLPRARQDESDITHDHDEEQLGVSEVTARITQRIGKLEEKYELVREQISALKLSLEFDRIAIQNILGDAMIGSRLIEEPHYEESISDGDSDEGTADEDLPQEIKLVTQKPKEPEVSDEEKAIKEARNNFWQAEQAYMCKLREFDSMEYYSAMRLRSYEEALQNGTAEGQTRSEFDRRDLYAKMWLTASLIGKERERDERREEAEELGAFDDGWGQESYYGDSQATVESLRGGEEPEGGYQVALKPATVNFIESWVENCDASDSPEVEIEDVKDDEWDAEPVSFSDSLSVVDMTSNAKNIAKWEYIREEAREGWPDGLGDTEDVDDALDPRQRAHSM